MGHAGDGKHFVHHRRASHGVNHGGVGVEDRDLVDAVTARSRVVVVLGHEHVRRGACIDRDDARGDDGGRIVPTECPGRLGLRKVAREMQQPASIVVGRERVFQHAEIDVTIGPNRGRSRAVVGQERVVARRGVFERDSGGGSQRRTVEGQ